MKPSMKIVVKVILTVVMGILFTRKWTLPVSCAYYALEPDQLYLFSGWHLLCGIWRMNRQYLSLPRQPPNTQGQNCVWLVWWAFVRSGSSRLAIQVHKFKFNRESMSEIPTETSQQSADEHTAGNWHQLHLQTGRVHTRLNSSCYLSNRSPLAVIKARMSTPNSKWLLTIRGGNPRMTNCFLISRLVCSFWCTHQVYYMAEHQSNVLTLKGKSKNSGHSGLMRQIRRLIPKIGTYFVPLIRIFDQLFHRWHY